MFELKEWGSVRPRPSRSQVAYRVVVGLMKIIASRP